ncbi:I78 family peptidase inhibitor [Rubellimicrobium roseum]|nr:I78 family peptidase inhibitor [Rubellimicrobium roseum]
MTLIFRLYSFLGFLTLAGCVGASRPLPSPTVGGSNPAGSAVCDSGALGREYVGRDASALSNVIFDSPVRILRPGDPVATDLVPNRVNFELDDRGTVARVTCG